MIDFPPWPNDDQEIAEALRGVYKRGDWGRYHGAETAGLVAELRQYFGGLHVRLCCSGTAAVELALRALGIEAGDEVVLAGYDFAGNFRAIEAVGARPVLIDVRAGGWTIDPTALRTLAQQEHAASKVRAVIVSHLHGELAEMAPIVDCARGQGWFVLEDACQVPGAHVGDRLAGTWGDIATLSFGGSKLLTAGRGGAVLSDREQLMQRIRRYADPGNDAYPLSELQAAVLRPQLRKLDQANRRRLQAARRLLAQVQPRLGPSVSLPVDSRTALFKLPWLLAGSGQTRERLVHAAVAERIPLGPGFRGFFRRSQRRCRQAVPLPNARRAAEQTILLDHRVLQAQPAQLSALAQRLNYLIDVADTLQE